MKKSNTRRNGQTEPVICVCEWGNISDITLFVKVILGKCSRCLPFIISCGKRLRSCIMGSQAVKVQVGELKSAGRLKHHILDTAYSGGPILAQPQWGCWHCRGHMKFTLHVSPGNIKKSDGYMFTQISELALPQWAPYRLEESHLTHNKWWSGEKWVFQETYITFCLLYQFCFNDYSDSWGILQILWGVISTFGNKLRP